MYLNCLTLITSPLTKGADLRNEICPLHAFKKEGMKREHETASMVSCGQTVKRPLSNQSTLQHSRPLAPPLQPSCPQVNSHFLRVFDWIAPPHLWDIFFCSGEVAAVQIPVDQNPTYSSSPKSGIAVRVRAFRLSFNCIKGVLSFQTWADVEPPPLKVEYAPHTFSCPVMLYHYSSQKECGRNYGCIEY